MEHTIKQNWALAQIGGYDSSKAAALDSSDIEPEIYDILIDSAHKGIETHQRWLEAHKKIMGYDTQYMFDASTPASGYNRDMWLIAQYSGIEVTIS